MKIATAALTGFVVFLVVATLSNAALYAPFDSGWPPNISGFWGLIYGSFAGMVGFGIALWVSSRGSNAGRWIVAATLSVFGLAVLWWIAMWGVPPFTLEGAWMYPLALVPLLGAAALIRSSRRHTTEVEPRRGSDR